MASPRKKWPQFTAADKKIPLGLWNDLLRTVEGLDGNPPVEGYSSREIKAPTPPAQTILQFVELDDAIGPDESSEFRDRKATVLYWDPSNFTWKRTDPPQQKTIVTDGYEHLVQDQGQRLVVWYHPQAGKCLPVNPNNMRQLKTCKDAGGYYPVKQECPNVYPTEHVTSSYPLPNLGSFSVAPTHSTITSLTTLYPQPPHGGKAGVDDVTGYVYNLAGGGDDEAYIPEGTVVPAWFLNGQWWTYWRGLAVCEASSSECSKSSSTVSASTKCTTSSVTPSSRSSSSTEKSTQSSSTTLSSRSSAYCTESSACSSRSSAYCTESSASCSSSTTTQSSPSSLQLWHLSVVTDVCCDDGDLVVVKRDIAMRWHAHSGGYVIVEIGEEDPPNPCRQGA